MTVVDTHEFTVDRVDLEGTSYAADFVGSINKRFTEFLQCFGFRTQVLDEICPH